MPVLIDGYNLLHASGVESAPRGRTPLERSRIGLLDFLAQAIEPRRDGAVTIVFDAAGAPPGLPDRVQYRGIEVRFARSYRDADELLEELVIAHPTPRRLTVVSSDHRVQRAAKRRRCKAVDADVWYEQVRSARQPTLTASEIDDLAREDRGELGDVASSVQEWLATFNDDKPTGSSHSADTVSAFSDEYLSQVADEFKAAQASVGSRKKLRPKRDP